MRTHHIPCLLWPMMLLLATSCGTADPGEPAPGDISAPPTFETIDSGPADTGATDVETSTCEDVASFEGACDLPEGTVCENVPAPWWNCTCTGGEWACLSDGVPTDAETETVEDTAPEVTPDVDIPETTGDDVGPEVEPPADTSGPADTEDPADVATTPDTEDPTDVATTPDTGPSSGCDVEITLAANGDVLYEASSPFSGFQIDHDGSVDGASGGDAEIAGWTIIWGPKAVLGIDATGTTLITATSGTLVNLSFSGGVNPDAISDFAVSGPPATVLTGCYAGGE